MGLRVALYAKPTWTFHVQCRHPFPDYCTRDPVDRVRQWSAETPSYKLIDNILVYELYHTKMKSYTKRKGSGLN